MTLTHRLTTARDGPKVITVTDSKLPYKFEMGMRVHADGDVGMFVRIDGDGEVEMSSPNGNRTWHSPADTIADIDHPGTRGLLLAQYREASGHEHAAAEWYDGGEWWVLIEPFDDPEQRPPVGRGESEGAAILDALTRLAASKAAAACPNAGPSIERRVQLIEDALDNDRLARIEARLARIEAGHV